MDEVVDRILAERTGGDCHDDLLRSLETAYAPDGCPAGGEQRLLRDEAMTTLLAGHETSAVGLAWTLHLLARHQDVAGEVRAEARATFGDDGPSAEAAGALVQTRAVVNEAMRLFPPVPWFGRRARAPDELLGRPIPAGAIVLCSPWLLHRDPRWWADPLTFDPGRFEGERNKTRRPWSFLPFGGGPRSCIGLNLAMTEMTVALAMIVRDFDLVPTNDPTPRPEALVTLRPSGPLRVTLEPVGATGG
jgi:cytochrome P450